MAACHILQDEIYPSQIVDDTLDTTLAATAKTLEEDLNYIRSVLKAIHGGTTWYDVGTGVADLLSDFPVEHYTTSENPAKAGQHKDIHADSLTTPTATIDTSILFSTTNYAVLNETTGPDGQAGSRLWIDGPNDAPGAATGVVFGPKNPGEYFNNFRIKAGRLDFETNFGYISLQTDSSAGIVFKAASTSIDKNFEVYLSDSEVRISPKVGTIYQFGELIYSYADDSWRTTKLKATNDALASLGTTDAALEVGNITGSGGIRLGNNAILAAQNTNQAAQLLLNPDGISEVVAWSGVSAANTFPIRVGSEGFGVWHEGNQGHTSGLDADTVDGYHAGELAAIIHQAAREDIDTATTWPPTPGVYEFFDVNLSVLPDTTGETVVIPFYMHVDTGVDTTTTDFTGNLEIEYTKSGTTISVNSLKIITNHDIIQIATHSTDIFEFKPEHLRAKFDSTNSKVILGAFLKNKKAVIRINSKYIYIKSGAFDASTFLSLITESSNTTKQTWSGNLNEEVSSISIKSPLNLKVRERIKEASSYFDIHLFSHDPLASIITVDVGHYTSNTLLYLQPRSILSTENTASLSSSKSSANDEVNVIFRAKSGSVGYIGVGVKNTTIPTNSKFVLTKAYAATSTIAELRLYEFDNTVHDVLDYTNASRTTISNISGTALYSINRRNNVVTRIDINTNISGNLTSISAYRYTVPDLRQYRTTDFNSPCEAQFVRSSNSDSNGDYIVRVGDLSGNLQQINITVPVNNSDTPTFTIVNSRGITNNDELLFLTYPRAAQSFGHTFYAYAKNGTHLSYTIQLGGITPISMSDMYGGCYFDEVTDTAYLYISIPRSALGIYVQNSPSGNIYPDNETDIFIIVNTKTYEMHVLRGDFSLGSPSSVLVRDAVGKISSMSIKRTSRQQPEGYLVGVNLPTLAYTKSLKIKNVSFVAQEISPTTNPSGFSVSTVTPFPGTYPSDASVTNVAPTNSSSLTISIPKAITEL